MRKLWWWGLMLGTGVAQTAGAWASEPLHGCFRTPAEAAAGVAAADPLVAQDAMNGAQGFRWESVRHDVLLRRSWAVVRSCEHPERPAVVVEMLRQAGDSQATVAATQQLARAAAPVMMAGARVEVVRVEANVQLRMIAVAQRSAAVGERVRLRVLREAGEGEQFVEGVVRGTGLVEMEAGR